MLRSTSRLFVAAACSWLSCCSAGRSRSAEAASGSPPTGADETKASAAEPSEQQVASSAKPVLVELEVSGFLPALVLEPAGNRQRLPVLVATHGAGDSAEWQCGFWSEIVENRGFVLCLRGREISKKADYGYYYVNHIELEKELLASLDALEKAYRDRVDAGAAVYTGYSQGASFGALVVVKHAKRFPRLALIEGGFNQWTSGIAQKYAREGGARVLFACGGRGCNARAVRSSGWLKKAGLRTRVEFAEGGGHTYVGAVGERVRDSFNWLVADDPRWSE